MVALLGIDIPQRQTGAIVGRVRLSAPRSDRDRRRRRFRQQSLDETLERRHRRLLGLGRLNRRRRCRGRRRQTAGETVEDGEQIRDRAAFGDVGANAPARRSPGCARERPGRRPRAAAIRESPAPRQRAGRSGSPSHRSAPRRSASADARMPASAPACVMALTPRAFRSSVSSSAEASPSQKMLASRLRLSNGTTSTRSGRAADCARAGCDPAVAGQQQRGADQPSHAAASGRLSIRQRDLEHAGRLAGAAARDHLGLGLEAEQREQPRERRRVEPAQRMQHRFANGAEDRRAHDRRWRCRGGGAKSRGCPDSCCGRAPARAAAADGRAARRGVARIIER